MSFIVAIDVGIKNLGLCVFDFCTNKIVHWDCVTLVPNGRYVPANNVEYVRNFVHRYDHYFSCAQKVLVERQIRCNMRIVEAILQTLFYDRCIVISARSVKVHYDLSTKNYRANKQKAVVWATEFLQSNPQAFEAIACGNWHEKRKQDDLADSLLLVMYYLDTYSNQMTSEVDVIFQG
tara:strand:+ start:714 stop:1247 length:534 start_codon:yes stop_codon:yes gene_type:complete